MNQSMNQSIKSMNQINISTDPSIHPSISSRLFEAA